MAGTLSQDEINALLSTVAGGGDIDEAVDGKETGSKKTRVHNFRRPDKFSKAHMAAMEMVYESMARHLRASLFLHIRQNISFTLASVEQTAFEEYVEGLSNPSALVVFSLEPLPGNAVLELNPDLTFVILDKLLGGFGKPLDENRELTDLEQTIIRKLALSILDALVTSWNEITEIKPQIETVETNPHMIQIVPPHEIVAVTIMEVMFGEMTGAMSICIPHLSLEGLSDKLSPQVWFASRFEHQSADNFDRLALTGGLKKIVLPVSVQLSSTTLTLRELLELRVGDAIRFDDKAEQKAEVKVDGRTKFYAKPGVVGDRLAVKTTAVVEDGE